MKLFVTSIGLVYGVLAIIAIATGRGEMEGQSRLMASVALSAWAAPVLAAWVVAEVMQALGARRVLDRRLRLPVRRVGYGLLVGVVGAVLGVLGMALLDRTDVPDAAMMGAGAALATVLVLLPTSRVRRGACLHCGYSFEGATPAARGVCVECGANLHAA